MEATEEHVTTQSPLHRFSVTLMALVILKTHFTDVFRKGGHAKHNFFLKCKNF